jgi:hypothetical protein
MLSRDKLLPEFSSWRKNMPPALVDRARIVIGDWPIIGSADTVSKTIDSLRGIYAVTKHGEVVPLFGSVKHHRGATLVDVKVSDGPSGNVVYPVRPVFRGNLRHAFGPARLGAILRGEYVRLGLEADLNIPRFISAQDIPLRFGVRGSPRVTHCATAIAEHYAQHGDEYCLTSDTNVLLGDNSLYRYALSKSAESHLLDYVQMIQNFLGRELLDASRSYGDRVKHLPYYSVRSIEFVWEFSHSEPTRLVEALELAMRTLGESTPRHRALVRGEEVGTVQDSFCISTELSSGCSLTLYAKTNKRVRFEIRMNSYCVGRTLSSGQTCNSIEELRVKLAVLRVWATNCFRSALGDLDRYTLPPSSGLSCIRFCSEVGRLADNAQLAHTVLETLRIRGSLSSPRGSPMRELADLLTKAGMLRRRVKRSSIFVPEEQWLGAVKALQEHGN